MPSGLPEEVAAFIAAEALLPAQARVLVAVSGGADSVALLRVLLTLGYACGVAHLDHGTREGESAADADFVRALASDLNCPYFERRTVVTPASGESFEMAARDVRYAFLLETARREEYDFLATGHHADDQAETILLRLLRGTSPVGMGGIAPVREQDGIRIVRPLLEQPREAIVAWLTSIDQSWREDHTNADVATPRNRVRHELLPYLAEHFNPSVRRALTRTARLMRQYDAMLPRSAPGVVREDEEGYPVIVREVFEKLARAEQGEVLQALAHRFGVALPEARVAAAIQFVATGPTGAAHDFGDGIMFRQGQREAFVVEPGRATGSPDPVSLPCPGTCRWGSVTLVARRIASPLGKTPAAYASPWRQVFDADALPSALCVRGWQAGDRMQPFGMEGSRKLQDIFTDDGVPAPKRVTIPVLMAGDTILWVAGYRRSRHAPVSAETRHIIEIEVRHAPE
jgi:tRNA(Ile)-lysidine synthase